MVKIITMTSACLAIMLTACSKEQTTKPAQSVVDNTTEQNQTLRIAAAANLSDVLPDIIAGYKTDKKLPAQEIEVTYASSGKLYAQIKAGAPYDLFLSADQAFPAQLFDEMFKSDTSRTPFTYTQGQLSIYSATKSLQEPNPVTLNKLLMTGSDSKITIANPELAPYGKSAKVYLESYKLYDDLTAQKRIIQAENIGQAFQYTYTGSVDYGFVAQSQLTAIKATPEQFYILPPESYPAILQDGIVITDVATAADFTEYLRSPTGQAYFSKAGYLAVK